jgi:PBP1b-binding outer membrane lipoprotein LpoB
LIDSAQQKIRRSELMERFKHSVLLMVVFAMAFVFVGCAKPPDAEKSAAKAAMDAAVSAGADKYAPTDFETAKGRWDTAESQMTKKDYKEAKQSYIDAKTTFEMAAGNVQAGKAAADAVNAALPSLENNWKNLEAAAKKAEKKMTDKQEDWAADAKTFTEGLQAAKDMVAKDPVGAKAKTDALTSVIDKWDAAFKELAVAPARAGAPKTK